MLLVLSAAEGGRGPALASLMVPAGLAQRLDPGVGVAQVLEVEGGLLGGVEPLGVQSLVDRHLGQLERERRLGRDPAGQGQGEVHQLAALHHVVDHPQPMGVGGGDGVAGEQQLLGPARAQLPGVAEPLHPVDPVICIASAGS